MTILVGIFAFLVFGAMAIAPLVKEENAGGVK
jgi:hypothetical protein